MSEPAAATHEGRAAVRPLRACGWRCVVQLGRCALRHRRWPSTRKRPRLRACGQTCATTPCPYSCISTDRPGRAAQAEGARADAAGAESSSYSPEARDAHTDAALAVDAPGKVGSANGAPARLCSGTRSPRPPAADGARALPAGSLLSAAVQGRGRAGPAKLDRCASRTCGASLGEAAARPTLALDPQARSPSCQLTFCRTQTRRTSSTFYRHGAQARRLAEQPPLRCSTGCAACIRASKAPTRPC